jgi:glutaminase
LMGKGLTFGELALIDGQTPAAHIVAESELACYGIAVDALRAFASSCQYAKILMNVIQDPADKLRFANETVHALEGL